MGKKSSAILFLAILCGCAGVSKNSATSSNGVIAIPSVNEEVDINAMIEKLQKKDTEYRISAADLIEIRVYREEELNRVVRVGKNGGISMPLIGNLEIQGKSLQEAEALVAEKLKDYLVNPQVSIFIKEYGNKKIYVLGEVTKPGSIELPPESRLTVLEAISLAGGFTQIAARDRTKIIRQSIDGKNISVTIPVSDIMKGDKGKDLKLEPNDVVYVPQSYF